MKKCNICKNGFTPKYYNEITCSKECKDTLRKARKKKWDLLNKDHCKEYSKLNSDKIKKNLVKWRANNPAKYKTNTIEYNKKTFLKRKKYYEDNKEVIKMKHKIYYEKNKKKLMQLAAKYVFMRERTDLNFKLKRRLRGRVNKVIKTGLKSTRTMELLGCSIDVFKLHLEKQFTNGMGWDNYGYGWHIDHIKPCCSFDLTKKEDQLKCFNYKNMQPLWAKDNLSKGGYYVG